MQTIYNHADHSEILPQWDLLSVCNADVKLASEKMRGLCHCQWAIFTLVFFTQSKNSQFRKH